MRLARAVALAVFVLFPCLASVAWAPPAFAQGRGGGAAAASSKSEEHTEELNMAIGETKTISASGVKNYSEGVPGVVDVRLTPDGNQFIITGKKQGNTTLLLIKNDQTQLTWVITVSQRSPQAVERELQQLIEGMNGVRVRRVGGRFFLEGGVTTEGELKRVAQIASLYAGQVESLVTVGSGGADARILVRLDFFYVYYERTSSYAVGLGWPVSIGGQVNNQQVFQNEIDYDFISKTTTTARASIVNQPLPELDIAQRHGWAKVLKQSTAITSNGSEATFNSGGEVNQVVTVGLTATLVKVLFGTNITVLPRFDPQTKEIQVKLDSDVAELTPAQGVQAIPGRNETKLNTFISLKLGQALVLSGIRTRTERHEVAGLPGLSQIPVLGVLFGSHSDEQQEVEGAIFIIPSIIETVPKSAIEVIRNALSSYDEFSGEIDRVDSYNKTPPSAK